MTRRLNYHWNLRRLMAAHNLWKTTDLIPPLRERGVMLSSAQIYRLVAEKPEWLNLSILAALCDILGCTPADLIEPYVESASRRQAVGEAPVVPLDRDLRPERARILDDDSDGA